MSKVHAFGILLCVAISMLACSEKSGNPKSEKLESLIYQDGRCQRQLFRSATSEDSCFFSQFKQDILIDFCVTANCCPDTSRFQTSSAVSNDTIFIVVADTAANRCLCDCPYRIHAEFRKPLLSRYVVVCYYGGLMIYRETVVKET